MATPKYTISYFKMQRMDTLLRITIATPMTKTRLGQLMRARHLTREVSINVTQQKSDDLFEVTMTTRHDNVTTDAR